MEEGYLRRGPVLQGRSVLDRLAQPDEENKGVDTWSSFQAIQDTVAIGSEATLPYVQIASVVSKGPSTFASCGPPSRV